MQIRTKCRELTLRHVPLKNTLTLQYLTSPSSTSSPFRRFTVIGTKFLIPSVVPYRALCATSAFKPATTEQFAPIPCSSFTNPADPPSCEGRYGVKGVYG